MALYDDLGGAPAIRAALDSFYPRVLADQSLSHFFAGVDIERLKDAQQSFFSMALGGPDSYTGRGLDAAHARPRAMGMTGESFDRFVGYFQDVLREFGVPDGKIAEVMALVESGRSHVLDGHA